MTKWQPELWTQVIFSYTYATYFLFLPYKYPSYSISLAFGSSESTQNTTQESHRAQSFEESFKQIQKFSLVERWLFSIYAARMSMIDIVQVIRSDQDVVTHVLKVLFNSLVWICRSFEHECLVMIQRGKKKKSLMATKWIWGNKITGNTWNHNSSTSVLVQDFWEKQGRTCLKTTFCCECIGSHKAVTFSDLCLLLHLEAFEDIQHCWGNLGRGGVGWGSILKLCRLSTSGSQRNTDMEEQGLKFLQRGCFSYNGKQSRAHSDSTTDSCMTQGTFFFF